jgi:hypothetical protein
MNSESDSYSTLLLDRIHNFIKRFLIMPNESDYVVLTLWIAHTYFLHKLVTTPRLAIISPEYGCGKSRVLEVLEKLCFKGEKLDHFTRSYLMRIVDSIRKESGKSPTLLLDELDTKFNTKSEEGEVIRAFVNSGYRDSGSYGITEGEGKNRKPVKFKTFAPMALAGKGEVMPESVLTRGIIMRMQRRAGNETVEDFLRPLVALEASEIVEALEDWSDLHAEEVLDLEPSLPVLDREREVWLPLFTVAELGGTKWQENAIQALADNERLKENDSISRERELLTDVFRVFEKSGLDTLRSSVLITELCNLPETDWNSFNYGRPINERTLAKKMKPYAITPRQIRFGDLTYKGYQKAEVEKAYKRYKDPVHDKSETKETSETEETTAFNFEEEFENVSYVSTDSF